MNVIVAGGGTAGHVNPAIAVAGELTNHKVTFIGTRAGPEARLVPAAGFELDTIEIAGFDRARPLSLVGVALKATGAARIAARVMRERSADAVLGMGGYVSLPVCYAARVRRVPIVLHEQNIVMGLANRVCKPVAERIAVSFEETLASAGAKGLVTGNPVLPRLIGSPIPPPEALRRFGLEPGRRTLLVFGGSRGAGRVNQAGAALAVAWRERTDVQVLHITGREYHERVADEVEQAGPVSLIYRTEAYVDDMSSAYAASDLVVCRGGATTVAELAAVGLPSIIVPYPHHRDRQQERHARVFEAAGAARVLHDATATGEAVARVAGELLADGATLARMGRAAKGLGRPDAARVVAGLVEEVAA